MEYFGTGLMILLWLRFPGKGIMTNRAAVEEFPEARLECGSELQVTSS